MSIKTISYSALSEKLREAIEWVKWCGASVHQTRYEKYQQLMDYWSHAYTHASEREGNDAFPDFATAAVEAVSLIRVHKSFQELSREQSDLLRQRLAKAVNGPFDASMEDSNSNSGRNYFFELATLANFHAPAKGLLATPNSGFDAGFNFSNWHFFIECKRPHSIKSLPKLMRNAASQIGKNIARTDQNNRAIIAIDASKILNPNRKILAARDANDLPETMSRLAQHFINRNARNWAEQLRYQSSRIVAVAVRLAFPATIGREAMLIAANEWGVWPTPHANKHEIALLTAIVDAARPIDD